MTTKKDGGKIGRDASTGRYIPVSEAMKRPKETVIERRGTSKAPPPKRK